jgi:hypothetical protein
MHPRSLIRYVRPRSRPVSGSRAGAFDRPALRPGRASDDWRTVSDVDPHGCAELERDPDAWETAMRERAARDPMIVPVEFIEMPDAEPLAVAARRRRWPARVADRIRRLFSRTSRSSAAAVPTAGAEMDDLEEARFWAEFAAESERLRADPEAWEETLRERAAIDPLLVPPSRLR